MSGRIVNINGQEFLAIIPEKYVNKQIYVLGVVRRIGFEYLVLTDGDMLFELRVNN
jgi:hypothetical protein